MLDSILNFLALDRYFGLDWAAAIFMFLSMHRLGIHKKDGFVFAALASICWIAFNLIAKSPAGVLALHEFLALFSGQTFAFSGGFSFSLTSLACSNLNKLGEFPVSSEGFSSGEESGSSNRDLVHF